MRSALDLDIIRSFVTTPYIILGLFYEWTLYERICDEISQLASTASCCFKLDITEAILLARGWKSNSSAAWGPTFSTKDSTQVLPLSSGGPS